MLSFNLWLQDVEEVCFDLTGMLSTDLMSEQDQHYHWIQGLSPERMAILLDDDLSSGDYGHYAQF